MEQPLVHVNRREFNEEYGEWEAEGTATRFDITIRWKAWLPQSSERWEVEIPGGQVPDPEVDEVSLVFDDHDPVKDVRAELVRLSHRQQMGRSRVGDTDQGTSG
jgi:hypothetical protein